jgi:hypothetical protein
MRRLGMVIAVAALLGVAASVAVAGNATKIPTRYDKFKLSSSGNEATFSGRLASPQQKCLKGRDVKLFRKHSGEKDKVGKDTSDSKGKFSIKLGGFPPKDGKYFAKAQEKRFGSSNDEKLCVEADSPSIKVS